MSEAIPPYLASSKTLPGATQRAVVDTGAMSMLCLLSNPLASVETVTERTTTLAEILHPMPTENLRQQLEEFRVEWERLHRRKVDLTKNYVSMWPAAAKDWLLVNDTQRYFDGLPEFAQDFLREKMKAAAKEGRLDDMHEVFLKLYVAGGMDKQRRGPSGS